MRVRSSRASAKLAFQVSAATVVVAVMALACGAGSPSPEPARSATFPVTINEAGGASVTITKRPVRIVSLSPTTTELLFAIGAGPQVVAVDDQSNYSPSAPMTKLSGFTPNVEAIVSYSPDLVVAADDTAGLVHGLAALNIPTLVQPAAKKLDDTYVQIDQLGNATGHLAEADALSKKMRADVEKILASVPKPSRPIKVYHELDDTYYSATSATFIGQAYTLLGLQNIADGATAAVTDYPQLSAEYIVSSNPDLIVLADTKCCHQNLQTVGARAGWGAIAAVKNGEVIGVDDDVSSRWGPRIVDFLQILAPHVREAEARAA